MSLAKPLDAPPLQSILDALPMGIWVARAPDGQLVYANAQCEVILGRSVAHGLTLAESIAAFDLRDPSGKPYPEHALPFVRALQERQTVEVSDLTLVRPDGSCSHLRAVAHPLLVPGCNEISHVVIAFRDVSDQVSAELESASARERLLVAVHHAPIVLFTAGPDGVITLSEGAGLRALNFKSGELVGVSVFDLYKNDEHILQNVRRAMSGETFTTITEHAGTILESWMAPLRDDGAGSHGMIGISTDISERQRLQQQMAQADRMSALGRLAASVAHEINNPLTYTLEAVRLSGELTQALDQRLTGGLGASVSELVSELQRLTRLLGDAAEGAERVRRITRDLTVFSHADDHVLRPVLLDQAVQAAAKLVAKRIATRAKVLLDLRCNTNVRADENRLVQIFVNLILNAADALPAGQADRQRIRISSRCEGESAVVAVADTGPGVSEALRERVFEPFYTTKSVGEGTGLGLYVTRGILGSLGGTISIDRAPEGGALFQVRLPLMAAGVADAPPSEPAPPPPERLSWRPRVMIVDDESTLANLLGLSLRDVCDVEVFHNGNDALQRMLGGATYDLVFCDLMMGALSGKKFYEELATRAPGREHGLIFMTGGVFDPAIDAFLQSISNDCLQKPFDIRLEVRKRVTALRPVRQSAMPT